MDVTSATYRARVAAVREPSKPSEQRPKPNVGCPIVPPLLEGVAAETGEQGIEGHGAAPAVLGR